MSKITEGTTVTLLSGGPLMTVEKVIPNGEKPAIVTCVWFEGDVKKRERFLMNMLKSSSV